MNILFITFSFIIIFLVILIYKYQLFVKDFIKYYPVKSYDEHSFKSGDIIFTRCNYLFLFEPFHYLSFNLFNYLFLSGIETHGAIVININNKKYVYNLDIRPMLDEYDKTYKYKTPCLVPLDKYLMTYTGEVFIYPTKHDFSEENIVNFIEKQHTKQFSIDQIRWANTILKLPIKLEEKYIICTHLIMEFLLHVNVINKNDLNFTKESANPQDIKRLLYNINYYDKPFMLDNCYNMLRKSK